MTGALRMTHYIHDLGRLRMKCRGCPVQEEAQGSGVNFLCPVFLNSNQRWASSGIPKTPLHISIQ